MSYPQQPAPGYPPPAPSSNKSTWALVLGILSLVCLGILAGIPAIILGNQAKKELAGTGAPTGMATAGVVMGWISVAWTAIAVILLIVLVAAS